MAVTPQITAALSVGPEDVLRPRAWLGGTMVASLQLLDGLRQPAAASEVSIVFRRPDGIELSIPAIPSDDTLTPKRWIAGCEITLAGTWAVRAVSLVPVRQVDWILFDAAPEPQDTTAPYAALWLNQADQPLTSTTGGLLSAARIDLLPVVTEAVGLTLPAVRTLDGATVQVAFSVITAGAQEAIADQVAGVNEAERNVVQKAGQVADDRGAVAGLAEATSQDRAATGADRIVTTGDRAATEAAKGVVVTAAASVTASVANAAPQFATWAQLTAYAPADNLLAVLFLADPAAPTRKTGTYRRTAGAWVWESDTLTGVDQRLRASGIEGRATTPAALALADAADNILALLDSANISFSQTGDFFGAAGIRSGLLSLISLVTGGALTVADGADNVLFEVSNGGIATDQIQVGTASSFFSGLTMTSAASDGVRFGLIDPLGNYLFWVDDTGVLHANLEPATGWTSNEIQSREFDNAAYRQIVLNRYPVGIISAVAVLAWIVAWGQSLSNGTQSGPVLSRTNTDAETLMLGDNVRGNTAAGGTWAPLNGATLKPLIATWGGNTVVANATADLVASTDATPGETIVEGFVRTFRPMQNASLGRVSGPLNRLVASSAGVGSRVIATFQPGQELALRLLSNANAIKAAAGGVWPACALTTMLFDQGQHDDSQETGAIPDRAGYGAALIAALTYVNAQVATAVFAQPKPPLVLIYQTRAASPLGDATDLGVQMGQWDVTRALPNAVVVGNDYYFPDKGTHEGSNGYRMGGAMGAKVAHRIQVRGEGWEACHIIKAELKAGTREVLVSWHVPVPPLVFDAPFGGGTKLTNITNHGYRVLNAAKVAQTIVGVRQVGPSTHVITLAALPGETLFLRYADSGNAGNGSVRDSDATLAADIWEYLAGTTQPPAENNPDMLNKPYPLFNFGLAWHTPIISV
jgi:hypothetical protein